jgi:tol-pal system protein YbgF
MTEVRVAQDLVSSDLARVLAELRSLDARSTEAQQAMRESAAEVARVHTRLQATEDQARETKAAPVPPRPPAGVIMPAPAPATAGARPVPPPTPPVTLSPPPAAPAVARPGPPPTERLREPAADEPAEQAYAAALNTFRAHQHGQAVLDFMDFIAKYPTHALAPNAQYWIGEAYWMERDYPQALVEFQRVLQRAPRAWKVPDALLMVGKCHAKLGQAGPAVQAWQRVVRDYPRSESAAKARSLLAERASTQP